MNILRHQAKLPGGRSLLVLSALAILAGVCFARLLANPTALIVDGQRPSLDYANPGEPRPVGNDLTFLFLPHHLSIAKAIAETGHVPMWDTRGFGGRPLMGNPQSGVFYPPTWLVWYFGHPAILGWLTVAHLIWGGIGTYLLARLAGQSRFAATIAAGCFQAAPYLMGHVFEGHYPHIWGVCWFPWCLWAFDSRRAKCWKGTVALPLTMLMVFIVGHPQEGFLIGLALCFRAFVDWTRSQKTEGVLAKWIGVMTIAMGLGAIDLAPQFANRPWKQQDAQAANPATEIPTHYSLRLINVLELLSPEALGGPADFDGYDNSWETKFSFGLVPLVLAIAALRLHPEQAAVRGWLLLGFLTAWVACGYKLGLFALIYHLVPGMNLFRVPARPLFLTTLSVALLAGFGVDALRNQADWRRVARLLVILIAIVAGVLGTVRAVTGPGTIAEPVKAPDPARGDGPTIAGSPADPAAVQARTKGWGREQRAVSRLLADPKVWILLATTVTLIGLGAFSTREPTRRLLAHGLGLLCFAELAFWSITLIQVSSPWRFLGPDPVAEVIAHARTSSPGVPARLKTRDTFYTDLRAVWNDFQKTNVDDSFQLRSAAVLYEKLYSIASRPRPRGLESADAEPQRSVRRRILDLMSVEYLVSNRVESEPDWPVLKSGRWDPATEYVIQANPSALPRAYVVGEAETIENDPDAFLGRLDAVDPRSKVLMFEDPLAEFPKDAGARQPFTPAEWVTYQPDHLELKVSTRKPGLLVLGETWMPGWTALVDGRPVEILRGNFCQRVISLREAGAHEIRLDYIPPGFHLGLGIFSASLAIWALVSVRTIRRLRPSSTPSRDASAATIPGSEGS